MCYGRMDNKAHKLSDLGEKPYFNGIDYSNARFKDFIDVDKKWDQDLIDRNIIPRMPWHDIGMKVYGKAAYDVGIHFIELWNHVMTDITGDLYKNKNLLEPTQRSERAASNF
jgi:phospholipase D1/2